MRTVLFTVTLMLAVGCGKKTEDTSPAVRDDPGFVAKSDPPRSPIPRPATPPKPKTPSPITPSAKKDIRSKLSFADAKEKILAMKKAEVKAFLGTPDDTAKGTFEGVNSVVWFYSNQRIIWNADTEKYYPFLAVVFYDVEGEWYNAVDVKTQ